MLNDGNSTNGFPDTTNKTASTAPNQTAPAEANSASLLSQRPKREEVQLLSHENAPLLSHDKSHSPDQDDTSVPGPETTNASHGSPLNKIMCLSTKSDNHSATISPISPTLATPKQAPARLPVGAAYLQPETARLRSKTNSIADKKIPNQVAAVSTTAEKWFSQKRYEKLCSDDKGSPHAQTKALGRQKLWQQLKETSSRAYTRTDILMPSILKSPIDRDFLSIQAATRHMFLQQWRRLCNQPDYHKRKHLLGVRSSRKGPRQLQQDTSMLSMEPVAAVSTLSPVITVTDPKGTTRYLQQPDRPPGKYRTRTLHQDTSELTADPVAGDADSCPMITVTAPGGDVWYLRPPAHPEKEAPRF